MHTATWDDHGDLEHKCIITLHAVLCKVSGRPSKQHSWNNSREISNGKAQDSGSSSRYACYNRYALPRCVFGVPSAVLCWSCKVVSVGARPLPAPRPQPWRWVAMAGRRAQPRIRPRLTGPGRRQSAGRLAQLGIRLQLTIRMEIRRYCATSLVGKFQTGVPVQLQNRRERAMEGPWVWLAYISRGAL